MRKARLILADIGLFLLGVTCGPGSVFAAAIFASAGHYLHAVSVLIAGLDSTWQVCDVMERRCGFSPRSMNPWEGL